MPGKPSPMLKVLTEIRDEVRAVRSDLRSTSDRLDGRIDSFDGRMERLDGRIDGLAAELSGLRNDVREGHVRLATEVIAVSSAIGDVNRVLRARRDERRTIADHGRRIARLERKVG